MKKISLKSALKNKLYYFFNHLKKILILILFFFAGITPLFAQWEECNNGLSDYEVWCFITDSNNTYVGIDGGVFMTTDNGDNWIAKNKGFISWKGPEVMSLAINGKTIFAGTMSDGIFISTDKGENWERKSNGLPCAINGLDTSFSVIIYAIIINGNNIYAGTHRGVYISTDNGENWTAKNNGLPRLDTLYRGVNSMVISGENNIFAGTTWNGVFMTSDNGDNWFNKNKGIGNLAVYSLAINGNDIYAGNSIWRNFSINRQWRQLEIYCYEKHYYSSNSYKR